MEEMNEKEFRKAVMRKFENKYKMSKEEDRKHIQEITDHVLRKFDGTPRADDDFIESDLRGIFYMLEEMDLLKMEITEKHIIDGRVWKSHYWIPNNRVISKLNQPEKKEEETTKDPSMVYNSLSNEVWSSMPSH